MTGEKTSSKLSGLRNAVLNLYDALALNVSPTIDLRYGFVTYTSTVNAGYATKELTPEYLVKNWNYEGSPRDAAISTSGPCTVISWPVKPSQDDTQVDHHYKPVVGTGGLQNDAVKIHHIASFTVRD